MKYSLAFFILILFLFGNYLFSQANQDNQMNENKLKRISDISKELRRLPHLIVDKPIYKPGDNITFKILEIDPFTRLLSIGQDYYMKTIFLKDSKGKTIYEQNLYNNEGKYQLSKEIDGGQYSMELKMGNYQKSFVAFTNFSIEAFSNPKLLIDISLDSKAYSASQKVVVVSKVKRADGSTPETPEIEFSVMLDGQIIKNQLLRLDKGDEGTIKFEFDIPADLSPTSSMIASVRVIDGGVVEQKTKSIPLVLSQEDFEVKFYPEGGKLISNVENRVYFEALSKSGDPVDVEIEVHNNFLLKSRLITKAKSKHEGRGYFIYTPNQYYINNYSVNVVKPFAKIYTIELEEGETQVILDRTVVEPESPVSFTLRNLSPSTKKYKVSIFQKEKEVSSRVISVTSGRVIKSDLPVPTNVVGVVRFRVSEIKQSKSGKKSVMPFFERLIFIKAVSNVLLSVECKNEQGSDLFSINSLVNCTVTSRDENRQPISVFLTVDVVDESVLSLVEKRKRRLQISEKVLLADELSNVEDGGSYFDEENTKADENLDLLMGVQGWRSFCYDNITEFTKKFGSKAERVLASSGYWLDDLNYFPERHLRRGGEARYFGGKVYKKERAVGMMAQMDGAMEKENVFVNNIVLSDLDEEEVVVEEKTYSSVNSQKTKKTTNKIHHRTNFLETLFTAHGIFTDSTTGQASFVFNTSDSVTSYRVLLEALIPDSFPLNIDNGFNMASHFSTVFNCRNNFYVEPKVPSFVLDGDSIHLPIMYVYKDNQKVKVSTSVNTSEELVPQPNTSIESFEMGESVDATRRILPLKVGDVESRREVNITLTVEADSESHSVGDMVTRTLVATPRGFKQNTFHSGVMQSNKKNNFSLFVPKDSFKISTKDSKIFPKPTSTLISSIEKLIQEPYGCFEQTSATLFPMIMALNYMKVKGIKNEELFNRANKILKSGYDKLASYEVKSTGGFEWFGRNPSSESLTAYGIFELEEMQKVYDNVDPNLISRAKSFLMGRKQDEGFLQGSEALDTFGRAPEKLTDAYIVWTLLKTKIDNSTVSSPINNLKKQVFSVSKWESDAYFLALVSDILFKVGQTEDALTIAKRLINFQQTDGRVENAQTTITCSMGISKTIETTSLSVLGWLNFPNEFQSQIHSSINYLLSNCNNGKFGSTQGTILALKALIEYDLLFPSCEGSAKVSVVVNNKEPLTFSFDSSTYNHVAFPSFEHLLVDNAQNTFEISIENENGKEVSFPFTLDISYRTDHPASHEESPFELKVDYINPLGGTFIEGYSYQVEVKLKNKWDKALGMCVLSVSVPGGFAMRHQKLKELVSSRQIAHYETRQNNIFFYFDFMKASQEISFTFDLDAFAPGKYSSTPSYAYVYYGDEYKTFLKEVFVAQISPIQ